MVYFGLQKTKETKNDMENYTKNPALAADAARPARRIDALGGAFDCRWDDTTTLSTNAHNALVSAFLKAGGAFDRLVETCPLRLASPNAPSARDVLGTAIVGMLGGASRYRHFDAIGGDAVAAEMFGLKRMMSCDSVRRNLGAIPEKEGLEWIWDANLGLLAPLLEQDYVLDLDPTVKPLYGRQEGAEIGYSPSKPGRPSHCYHTLCIARLRLVLGVVIHAGDETSGVHSCGMLDAFLKWLPGRARPGLVRGDVGFGNETVIACCESNGVPYLFKLKRTRLVKDLFQLSLGDASAWRDAGEGWQCADTRLQLGGWGRQRRVLLMRRPVELKPRRRKEPPHRKFEPVLPGLELVTCDDERYSDGYEWYALVTDLGLDPRAVSKLYRERGDCENVFDEMKNQWGWGGFVTRDMKRTALAAGLSAFVANCWNIFCRLGGDGSHQEATTTRRRLQDCVARIARHGRRRTVTLFTAGKSVARRVFGEISAVLEKVSSASQLTPEMRWLLIIYYAFRKYRLVQRLYPPLMGDQITLPLS